MSIEDDEYDLDDDVLDGMFEDDDFDDEDLDDFDEADDEGMSFDEDDVLFDDDEDGMGGASDDALIGVEKKKFAVNIGFDKIAIIGAVIVGVIVLAFQVTTKKPTQGVETFQSALTMKGATDGEVFGESQSKDITPTAPQNQGNQQAFLYEPDALNVLPNNLKEGVIVKDLEIAPVKNPAPAKKVSEFVSTLRPTKNTEVIGEFVSTSGDVLKSQMDFIPEELESVQKETSDFEQELKELEGLNAPDKTEAVSKQEQEDLTFVPIAQVIETQVPVVNRDVAIEQRAIESQAETQRIEDEVLLLRREVENLKREKARLAEAARIEKEGLKQIAASNKRLEEEKVRLARDTAAQREAQRKAKEEAQRLKKAQEKRVMAEKAVKPATVAPPAVKGRKVVDVIWELRAAQPGKAWISEKGKQDIIAVNIGSDIRGLGKITAISMKNKRWVVTGTEGAVQQ